MPRSGQMTVAQVVWACWLWETGWLRGLCAILVEVPRRFLALGQQMPNCHIESLMCHPRSLALAREAYDIFWCSSRRVSNSFIMAPQRIRSRIIITAAAPCSVKMACTEQGHLRRVVWKNNSSLLHLEVHGELSSMTHSWVTSTTVVNRDWRFLCSVHHSPQRAPPCWTPPRKR